MKKIALPTISLILLVYMLLPGPRSIENFPALPSSAKSTLSGDTVQIPNVAAYFSNNFRVFSTKLYFNSYKDQSKVPFNPLRLNYPPEFAYTAIKDQTQSTYLEEYVYPLRDSLFVNGMEPFEEDGKPRYWGASKFSQDEVEYLTKVTLRYYPSTEVNRIIVWLLINVSFVLIWTVGRKVISNE